jgi:hypothetical protein
MTMNGLRRGAFERALVDALRTAAAKPSGPPPVRAVERHLAPWLDAQTAEGVALDLLALTDEIDLAKPARALMRSPGEEALGRPEFAFLATLAALQESDICRAIAELSRMLQHGRIGRVLFPMKFLAVRLDMAGVRVAPIGVRRFTVIAGGRIGAPHPAARPPLTVAS